MTKAAIISLETKQVWAKSAVLEVSLSFHGHRQIPRRRCGATLETISTLTYAEICFRLSCTQLSSDDVQQLATAFNNLDAVRASGLKVGGVKHLCLNADSNSISLKSLKDPVSPIPSHLQEYYNCHCD